MRAPLEWPTPCTGTSSGTIAPEPDLRSLLTHASKPCRASDLSFRSRDTLCKSKVQSRCQLGRKDGGRGKQALRSVHLSQVYCQLSVCEGEGVWRLNDCVAALCHATNQELV